jgi:hypothetical protein
MTGNEKKSTTDFTIDCILSKSDESKSQKTITMPQKALNKVLDNPWIPKKFPFPLAFNCYSKKWDYTQLTIPNLLGENDYLQNFIPATQHHTPVQNQFYADSKSNSIHMNVLSLDTKLLPKSSVYENESISCDTLSISEEKKNLTNVYELLPESGSKCSKFENKCEMLDVS